jgi:organic hydroperoxide reductase OsmC/OhrA
VIDSSDEACGTNPMQMLLMSIAGCTSIDVSDILVEKNICMTAMHRLRKRLDLVCMPEAWEGIKFERLCRYIARPTVSEKCLPLTHNKGQAL